MYRRKLGVSRGLHAFDSNRWMGYYPDHPSYGAEAVFFVVKRKPAQGWDAA